MKKRNLLVNSISILVFVAILSACFPASEGNVRLHKTSEEMQTEVNRFVKIGMPIQKAINIFENSGFTCEDHKNEEFAIERRDRNETLLKQTILREDFYLCGRDHSYILANQSWQVFLVYKEEKVTITNAVVHWQNL
jgi:hypothetical protein